MPEIKPEHLREEYIHSLLEDKRKLKTNSKKSLEDIMLCMNDVMVLIDRISVYLNQILIARKKIDEEKQRQEALQKKKKKKAEEPEKSGEGEETAEEGEKEEKEPSGLQKAIQKYKERIAKTKATISTHVSRYCNKTRNSSNVMFAALMDRKDRSFQKKLSIARLKLYAPKVEAKLLQDKLVDLEKHRKSFEELLDKITNALSEKQIISFYNPIRMRSLPFIEYFKEMDAQKRDPYEPYITGLGEKGTVKLIEILMKLHDRFSKSLMDFYYQVLDSYFYAFVKEYNHLYLRSIHDMDAIQNAIEESKQLLSIKSKGIMERIDALVSS